MMTTRRMLKSLSGSRLALLRAHASARFRLGLALAVFALLALVFALLLGTVMLAHWIGMIAALAVGLGLALLGCLIIWLRMQAEAQRHAQAAALASERRRRRIELVLLASTPGQRKRMALAVGLAALTMALLSWRGG